jgi:hypothetical protein
MIDDSKKLRSDLGGIQGKKESPSGKSNTRFRSILINSNLLIPVGSGVLQILVGLSLVGISILGLISPLWLSAVLSLAGSISCMAGMFLIYHAISTKGAFESLINQSIRRVISAQN